MKTLNTSKKSLNSLALSSVPNLLSVSRIILTFVVIYLIFTEAKIATIIIVFSIAALTDWFDGQLARKFHWESEFGRKIDIIADRFLWGATALSFIVAFGSQGDLMWIHGAQLLLIMSREIITLPFAVIAFFSGNALPKVRSIAKATTFLQGFALPLLILSTLYPNFVYISFPLSITTAITGFMSALYYREDTQEKREHERTG